MALEPKQKNSARPYCGFPIDLLPKSADLVPEETIKAEQADIIGRLNRALDGVTRPQGMRCTGKVVRGPTVSAFEIGLASGRLAPQRLKSLETGLGRLLECGDVTASVLRTSGTADVSAMFDAYIPNRRRETVTLGDVLRSEEFGACEAELCVALGKDAAGISTVCVLEEDTPLLIGGATGSGKSAFLHSLILSLVLRHPPQELTLCLADPRTVEFCVYKNLPHLFGGKIFSEAEDALQMLKSITQEAERRLQIFSEAGIHDIKAYNASFAVEHGMLPLMPRVVCVMDEFSDFMLGPSRREFEQAVLWPAQKARAAGVYLVFATQRPSVNVITGVYKYNFPSRIAFATGSISDSRTIIGEGGAEKLLGRGDMLYYPVGLDGPVRVQGAYVSQAEVEAVAAYMEPADGAGRRAQTARGGAAEMFVKLEK